MTIRNRFRNFFRIGPSRSPEEHSPLLTPTELDLADFPPLERQCSPWQKRFLTESECGSTWLREAIRASEKEKAEERAYEKEQERHYREMKKLKDKTRKKLILNGMEGLVWGGRGMKRGVQDVVMFDKYGGGSSGQGGQGSTTPAVEVEGSVDGNVVGSIEVKGARVLDSRDWMDRTRELCGGEPWPKDLPRSPT